MVSETKLDQSFPTAQFEIPGFATPYRLERYKHGDGSMLYVHNDSPYKLTDLLYIQPEYPKHYCSLGKSTEISIVW